MRCALLAIGAAFGYLVLANELSPVIAPIAGPLGVLAVTRRLSASGLRHQLHSLPLVAGGVVGIPDNQGKAVPPVGFTAPTACLRNLSAVASADDASGSRGDR